MWIQSTHRVFASVAVWLFVMQPVLWGIQVADEEPLSSRLQKLRQERLETLQDTFRLLMLQTEAGAVDQNRVTGVQDNLVDAICEGVPSRAERIELLTRQCEVYDHEFQRVQGGVKAGLNSELDECQSRGAFLRAQIRLLIEQSQSEAPSAAVDQERLKARLQQLRHDRAETLQRAVTILTLHAEHGSVDPSRLAAAHVALMEAALEAAGSKAERIQNLTAICQSLDTARRIAERRLQQGVGLETDICQARTTYLRVAIRLLQEQANPAGSPRASEAEAQQASLRQLQEDYLRTMQREAQLATLQAQHGVDLSRVLRAQVAFGEARYDAATSPTARIQALTAQSSDLSNLFNTAQDRVARGVGSPLDVPECRAAYLQAQILLVQEQLGNPAKQ